MRADKLMGGSIDPPSEHESSATAALVCGSLVLRRVGVGTDQITPLPEKPRPFRQQ